MKIKAPPPKNSLYIFFYSTPKEILNFYNVPLTGGGEGVRVLNAVALWLLTELHVM